MTMMRKIRVKKHSRREQERLLIGRQVTVAPEQKWNRNSRTLIVRLPDPLPHNLDHYQLIEVPRDWWHPMDGDKFES